MQLAPVHFVCLAAAAAEPPPWRPHYDNLGSFAAETLETSLFYWKGAGPWQGRLILLESIGCHRYDESIVNITGGAAFDGHSYFRIRDLHSGTVIANMSQTIGFAFGNAFVDYDHGTAWVFGTKHDRCVNDHACDRCQEKQASFCAECKASKGVWS